MRVSSKLGVTFIASVASIGIVAYIGAFQIERNVNNIIEAETDKVEAALEMEINLNEAAASLFTYLTDANARLKERYLGDIGQLHTYLEKVKGSANTQEDVQALNTVSEKLLVFESDADKLFTLKDNQANRISVRRDLLNNYIDPLLDEKLQVNLSDNLQDLRKKNYLQEIEINVHELISAVRGYLLRNDSYLKERFEDSLSDLEHWLNKYEQTRFSESDKEHFDRLKKYLVETEALSRDILDFEDQKQSLILEVESLVSDLDRLFDLQIQKRAESEIFQARKNTLNLITTLEIVIVISILLAIGSVYLVTRPMARNFRELLSAISVVSDHTNFAAKVDISSNDEFGELATAFNKMSSAIKSEKMAVETANLKLRKQIAERDNALAEKQEADAANTAKSAFLAAMSHEIRTPLNAVIGLTELTLRTDLNENQKGLLTKVVQSGKNLLALINDILDYSKISAGKLQIETVDFALNDVLNNMSTIVTPKAEENGNEVIISVAPDVPNMLRGDPLRLGQILINLVGNAVKFTSQGEVLVTVTKCSFDDGQERLKISVKDSGIGMTKAQCARLFQAFSQADDTVSRQFGGTGLGLSISKQLVEAMGGDINVESAKNKGSNFYFDIALIRSDKPEIIKQFVGLEPHSLKILVVDDNELARETLARALEKMEFRVETVPSGKDAIVEICTQKAKGLAYDLILIDWKMPGMDGIETIRRIRGVQSYDDTSSTIFMVSAMDMDLIAGDCASLDVGAFLHKPLNTSLVFNAIMDAFGKTENIVTPGVPFGDTNLLAKIEHRGKRLLIAEDNEVNQIVAEGVLARAGFELVFAENGRIAVETLRNKPKDYFDMVLMDIQMPEMDGLSATRFIRNDLGMSDLPIIAMTANALDEDRDISLSAGMVDHITKPIDAREVINKVNMWLDRFS